MTLSLPGKMRGAGTRHVKPAADQAGAVPVNSKRRMERASPARTNKPVTSIQPLAGSGTGEVGEKVSNMDYRPRSKEPVAVAMTWVK
jgi:hypothetical protein